MGTFTEIRKVELSKTSEDDPATPDTVILAIGGRSNVGTDWRLTIPRAVEAVEAGKYDFFIRHGGTTVDVVIGTFEGRKYLKSKADDVWPNSLVELAPKQVEAS